MADISLLPTTGQLSGLTAVQKINEGLTSLNEANRLGIPAWSSTTSYGAGALTWDAGQTYKSTVDNSGQRPSTTPASWVSWGLTLSDLQNGYETMADATGTAGAYAANYWPAITGLANGQELRFKVPIDNAGASTLAVNAIPAAPILSLSGSTLQRGELVANGVARVRWSATRNAFILLNCEGAASSGSGLPLLFPLWCPSRAAIPAGYAPADGQTLSRSLYPDAWAGIAAGNVPVATDAAWLATPTERGKFTAGDGAGTFRLPDYNGKSAGSLGAVFMRGDGALSAGADGVVQGDAIRNITGQYCNEIFRGAVGASLLGAFYQGTQGTTSGAAGGTGSAGYNMNFDASRVVPTANENRPLNVTGCWVIRLFGAVVNPGAADAAQLATAVSAIQGAQASKLDVAVALGQGNPPQDMTASRSSGTWYYATTRPLFVYIQVRDAATVAATVYLGSPTASVSYTTNTLANAPAVFDFMVPAGCGYRVDCTAGILKWIEAR